MDKHLKFMKIALEYASKAYIQDEVPVGAVIVKDDHIVACASNTREQDNDTLGHAEINAIRKANDVLDTWNLSGCTLYVTMEPCLMCSGAIKESRIKRVVYGCSDKKGGYLMSNTSISSLFNIEVIPNVLEVEASNILKKYFENKRSNMIKVSKLKFSDLSAYFNLRREVFVEEQGVSHENEFDAYDKTDLFHVEHIAARNNNEVIGTMRLIYDTNHKTIKLGRLAVKKSERNKNIGKRLLDYAERQAKSRGFDTVLLSAQLHALEFYKKNGYREEGTTYIDAGIEHVKMKKSIK